MEWTSFWHQGTSADNGQSSELPPKPCSPKQTCWIWEGAADPKGVWTSEMLHGAL